MAILFRLYWTARHPVAGDGGGSSLDARRCVGFCCYDAGVGVPP